MFKLFQWAIKITINVNYVIQWQKYLTEAGIEQELVDSS